MISGDWFIENAEALLDAPAEFFYNESAQTLFLVPNGTAGAPPAADTTLVVPLLKSLLTVVGTSSITIRSERPGRPRAHACMPRRPQPLPYRDSWPVATTLQRRRVSRHDEHDP
jgi:hypothetical protein